MKTVDEIFDNDSSLTLTGSYCECNHYYSFKNWSKPTNGLISQLAQHWSRDPEVVGWNSLRSKCLIVLVRRLKESYPPAFTTRRKLFRRTLFSCMTVEFKRGVSTGIFYKEDSILLLWIPAPFAHLNRRRWSYGAFSLASKRSFE